MGACEKDKTAVQSGQCSPKRNGARLPISYSLLLLIYLPSHLVGPRSYKECQRIL